MGELGFTRRSVWVMFINAYDHCVPSLLQIEDLPDNPDDQFLSGLMQICGNFASDDPSDCRVAMLVSRPGSAAVTPSDLGWARGLRDAARSAGVSCEGSHLANDDGVRPLTPDDIGLAEPA